MKPLPFPYAIAAEFWLFGPPARKQTLPHLLTMTALFGSGAAVFFSLQARIGRLGAGLVALPLGMAAGYGLYWLFAQILPLLHWLVARGIVEKPDEARFRKKILSTACWKEPENKE